MLVTFLVYKVYMPDNYILKKWGNNHVFSLKFLIFLID